MHILYRCTDLSSKHVEHISSSVFQQHWCGYRVWHICTTSILFIRASVCKKETKEGSAARPQNRSICRADIKLINDISRCLDVSKTTLPQLLRGFAASYVYSMNISHSGNAWCHSPRGGDRTGRSKITHYRRINAAEGNIGGEQIFFETYQQPWNEMVWIFISILKTSGAPVKTVAVGITTVYSYCIHGNWSWKNNCAGS